jgi:hypothetical protein
VKVKMSLNNISAEIPQETENTIIQSIKDTKDALPFLVDLTNEERIRLAKMSRKSVDFVDKSLLHANNYPQYVPPYLDLEEFQKDVELRKPLYRIQAEVASFQEKLRDTILLVESDAHTTARVFYKSIKAAAKEGQEAAEDIAKDLAFHYKKAKPTEEPAEKDAAQPRQNADPDQ